MAAQLLEKGDFGDPTWRAYRTPGYPYFLAGIYAVFGRDYVAVGIIQAVMGGITSGMIVLLASHIFGVRASVFAGLVHVLCPTTLSYVPVLASENLAVFLLVLGLLLLRLADERRGWPQYCLMIVSGVACGLLLLTRPAGLLLVPAWLALVFYNLHKKQFRFRSAAVFVAAVLIVLSPWFVRNYRYGLGPCALSTVGPLNLYMGNCDSAIGGGYNGTAEREDLTGLPEQERAAAYTRETIDWILHNPGRYALLCWARCTRHMGTTIDCWPALFLRPTEESDRVYQVIRKAKKAKERVPGKLVREHRVVARGNAKFLEYCRVVEAPLVLLALALSFQRWRRFSIVVIPALCYIVGISMTFGGERFRELSNPLLFIPLGALQSDILFGGKDLSAWPSRRYKVLIAVLLVVISYVGWKNGYWDHWYTVSQS